MTKNHIEALKINGTDTSDPHPMANGLNDFFTKVAQSLAGKLKSPINHYSRYLPSPKLTSMGIIPTTPRKFWTLVGPSRERGVKGSMM